MATPILEARNLKKYFYQSDSALQRVLGRGGKAVKAVDDVTLSLEENEVEGVIGESGCGKSTLFMTLLGLHEQTEGTIYYKGQDTSEFDRSDWKNFRRNVQVIFQDPFDSLDPKLTVRETLRIPLKVHNIDDQEERILDTLELVELNPPERYVDKLPGQLSGGEKQRVSIARALILEPEVILADEPVSMLDVSTQAVILNFLSDLTDRLNMSMLYISHDLSTVGYICDTVNVMYLGRIIEQAPTNELISDPKHPYSRELINAIPIPDPEHDRPRTQLQGSTPDPINIGAGCRFRDRCPDRMDICEKTPRFITETDDRKVACHLYYDHEDDATLGGEY